MTRSIQRIWKRVLSAMLVFALLIPMIPVPVFAEEAFATPTTYAGQVEVVTGYLEEARDLIDTPVPDGGEYNPEEFQAAITEFIRKVERDLHIVSVLYDGNIQNDKYYVEVWTDVWGARWKDTYPRKSQSTREENAFYFFKEGGFAEGFSVGPIGYRLEYRSSFHPTYSSGLFGIGENKTDVVAIMYNTVESLKLGNSYMTDSERAIFRYNKSLAALQAIKENPAGIVTAVLQDSSNEDLRLFIADLNLIIDSLDDIIRTIDTLQRMGIGKDLLDPILAQVGMNYDTLIELTKLRDTLRAIGIDVSGEANIEDSIAPAISIAVKAAIDFSIGIAQTKIWLSGDYNGAADTLEEAYKTLVDGATKELKKVLAPTMKIVEDIRPYLGMMSATISLVDHTATLTDQIKGLSDDFTVGGLSEATYTMAYSLEDIADLLTAFKGTELGDKLAVLLENTDVGDSVAEGTAGLLNKLIEELIKQDVGISGSDLGFLRDTANSLLASGLENPTALVPLLRTSADILKRVAELEGGIQDIIDGDYESAWIALSNNFGSMIRNTVKMWNELVALFETPAAAEAGTFAMSMGTGDMNLETLKEDEFLTTFAQGISDEATETLGVLKDPSASSTQKLAKINAFKDFLKDIGKFVGALEEVNKNVKNACTWAEHNLSREDAKAFTEQLARHYVERMRDCVKSGLNSHTLRNIIDEMKEITSEIKDLLCLVKATGDFEIRATKVDDETAFYTFTTNYDGLREKLDGLLNSLGISTGYTVNSPENLFEMDENALQASGELAEGTYSVKVAYKLFFHVCGHDVVCTLGTKWVDVEIGAGTEEPELTLTGISITPPTRTTYTVGDALDLTGLVVMGTYEDANGTVSNREISSDNYLVNPAGGTILGDAKEIPVVVAVGDFSETFSVTVSPGEEEKQAFTVTFNANEGTLAAGAPGSERVEDGTEIILPGATRANYTLNGWYDGEVNVGKGGSKYVVSKDVILMARWSANTSGGSSGRGTPTIQIKNEEVPLSGAFSLMSLPAEPKDGIVYYVDNSGKTIFVPFCFVIGDRVYFFGQAGIDYHVKSNPKQFGDAAEHWAHDNILAIASREVFQGYPDNSFQPNSPMTRGMLASVLARMAMADTGAYTARVFDDVAPDTWYGPSVAWAFEKGIVSGVGNNKFDPNANVTRQEISVMLSRFVHFMEIEMKEGNAIPFADLNLASTWAKAAITDMQKYEILAGKANNVFDPYADSTRAEIAAMLHRLIQTSITYAQQVDAEKVKEAK